MEEAVARVRTVRGELQRHAAKSSIGFAVRTFLLGSVDDELQLLEHMLTTSKEDAMTETPRLDRAIETVTELRDQINAGENWSEQVIELRLKDVLDELLLAHAELAGAAGWQTGRPPDHGYYLAAWRRGDGYAVSELWFNPDSTGSGWWASRRYLNQERVYATLPVVAWMPMPAPPSEGGRYGRADS